ncbi:right-handed parallel beta-helix repeat-containing protein [Chitiniphilus purpureus]|uniref:Right-handed parallel beta-helix repeat-containing protein n=1 Tax=Chitiniphilus purpureus TaxID=2981137 RepID=A0ABY6DYL3_9NEIS|nr:right-handed parallel beta-helix repeat-containing protein [Chitiniphilus sp. CD1]UXY16933.1 right-handed parallel beta-helix repeat-containing protein [Chitiniphilus sp. CD1]
MSEANHFHRTTAAWATLAAFSLLTGCDADLDSLVEQSLATTSLQASSQSTTPAVLNLRVKGLGLGKELALAYGSTSIPIQLNGAHSIALPATGPANLQVATQPAGQTCKVAESTSAAVPADGTPVFVRCVHNETPTVVQPDTLPNAPLSASFGLREYAYPGIPYESRPGVVGGIFPYEYRIKQLTLNGAAQSTANVSVDFRTGAVRFTPASAGTYVLTLEIRDSGSIQKTLEQSFTITASTAKFIFVSPGGTDAPGKGTLADPYQSVAYAVANSAPDQVILLRKGTYLTNGFTLYDTKSQQLLAYPDEVATLDLNQQILNVYSVTAPAARIEGVDITRVKLYGIKSESTTSGLVIRNVRFVDGVGSNSTKHDNPGFIHGTGHDLNTPRHKLLIQDNDFGPFNKVNFGSYAVILFDAGDSLVENNQIRLGTNALQDGIGGGIHEKDNSQGNTHRENYIDFPAVKTTPLGIQVSAQAGSRNIHVHHNLLINSGIYLGLACFASYGCTMRDHDVHHNTVVNQSVYMNWGPFNPGSYGTRISYNVLSARTKPTYSGLSCQPEPPDFNNQIAVSANFVESVHAQAFKDSECSARNKTWPVWRDVHGMDTFASGSELNATTSYQVSGSGPLTGLPAGHPRRGVRGHQW